MSSSSPLERSRAIFERLASATSIPAPDVRAWDGTRWGSGTTGTTLVLRHPGALRAMLVPPSDLTLGEAYLFDDIDVEGSMVPLLAFMGGVARANNPSPHVLVNVARGLPLLRELLQLPAQRNPRGDDEGMPLLGRLRRRLGPLGALGLQTRAGQKRSISYHYDREAEFFRTFLGESMVYSAGAFLADDGDLDQAQRRKLDLICRKLELRPDTRLLDIGCGWGSLLVHAATNYGVAGTGVTLSREQADYARRWAERVGVGHRVTVHVGDYRDFCRDPGNARAFDAIASVGMLAHIGEHEKASYFGGARRVLAPGGAFLCHGITTRRRPRLRGPRKPMFVRTWMFPDGHLDHLETVIEAAEWAGFELRDAESLAECYSVTLRNWCTNLERNREAALAIASERDYRMWRYFHALCSVGFSRPAAELTVHQLLLTDPHRPWHFGRRHCLAEDDR